MHLRNLIVTLFFGCWLAACTFPRPTVVAEESPVSTESPAATPTEVPETATPTATATPVLTPSATPPYPVEGYGPTGFPENVNPLTGVVVSDPSILQRRALGIKVNIVPRQSTRPPWGLSSADIVYEFYQNDGYSRFHAIFLGEDAEMAGPIRSARLLDGDLIHMYKTIFAYGGADFKIDSRLLESDYSDRLVRERGPKTLCPPIAEKPLCRHDPDGLDFLLGGTQELHAYILAEGIDDVPQDLDGMHFRLEPPPNGQPGVEVTTRYSIDSYSRWEYDPRAGEYLRFQDSLLARSQEEEAYVALTDRLNEEQVRAANVVILVAAHEYVQEPPAEIVEILLNGSGPAYAFRDGQVYEVRWSRPTPDSVLTLTWEDGSNYPFKPGKTWFQIIGRDSRVIPAEDGAWRFEFVLS